MIALFDLDGTILPWDTQKLFCHYVLRRHPLRRLFLLVYLPLLPFAPILGSEGLKRVFLCFLWGFSEAEVRELAKGFAEQWIPSQVWPEMREKIQHHRQQGDLTILVSASPEPYVEVIGALLGFDRSVGTVIDFPPTGLPLFPDLVNNKGHNKVKRLRKMLDATYFDDAGKLKNSHGYTDSRADLPMLALCDHGTVINPSEKLLDIATQQGWNICHFPRPWKNPWQRCFIRAKYVLGL